MSNQNHKKRYISAFIIIALLALLFGGAACYMGNEKIQMPFGITAPLKLVYIAPKKQTVEEPIEENAYVKWKPETPLDSWVGEYVYVETFSHNSGELSYFIGISITIYEQDGDFYAQINGDGWFLETRSLAKVAGNEDSIDITFLGNAVDDPLYERNIQRYENGEELVHFERLESGEINTEWKSLRDQHPFSFWVDEDEEISGIYFAKVDSHEDDIDEQDETIVRH